jgi:hypothetical protein
MGGSGEGITDGSEEVIRKAPVTKQELVKSKAITKPESRMRECPAFKINIL